MKVIVAFALAVWVGVARLAASPASETRPTITGIAADPTNITVTVNVPAGVIRVTLESRTRLGAGAWVPRAVQRVTAPGVITFRLAKSAQLEVLRVRGDTDIPVPAVFFAGQTNFTGQLSAINPTNSVATALPGAGVVNSGAPADGTTRTVVESDIWVVRGNLAYFFNQYRGLQVIDLSQPDAPAIRGTLDLPAAGEQMYLVDDQHAVLLVNNSCDNASEALIVDVSAAPKIIATLPLPGYIQESRLVGSALYVASGVYRQRPGKGGTNDPAGAWEWGTAVNSFDLSTPTVPVARGSLWFAGYGNVIVATDQYLFAVTQDTGNGWQSNVQVVDISAPDGTMNALGSFSAAGYVSDKYELNVDSNVLTVISAVWEGGMAGSRSVLETVSLADPAAPRPLGKLDFGAGESLSAARFDGTRAYVATTLRVDPLWVVDLSDPARPKIAGSVQVPGFSTYIEPLGDRLLTMGIAGTNDWNDWRVAVSLYDVQDAAKPTLLSQVPLGKNYSWSEATYNDKAFTVLPDAGLILVPYQGWSSNGFAAAIQLLDLGTNALTARGIIQHTMQARRATLLGDRIVSISGRELLTVNAADRDHPVVTADLELSWPVNHVLLAGNFLIEIANAMSWQGAPNPVLRVVSTKAPETELARVELTNGLPVLGANVHDGHLYLLQGVTSTWLWLLPAANDTNAPPPPTNRVFLSVFDLSGLPGVQLLGQTQTLADNLGWNARLQAFWLATNRLVWAGGNSGGWGPVPLMAAAPTGAGATTGGGAVLMPVVGGSFWWPWWGGGNAGQMFACDTSDPAAPSFTAAIDLATNQQWWAFNGAFAAGNLIYVSHQASEFQPGVLLPGQTPPSPVFVTNADGAVTWKTPPCGIWVTKYYLDVVDFTDPTTPTVRAPVNIPGQLQGLSRGGALLYTVGTHWDAQGNTDGSQYLDASAYDGVSASLVASMKLTVGTPPLVMFGEDLVLPQNDSTANTNRLETWTLADTGKFTPLGAVPLAAVPNNLAAFGNLLAVQLGATVGLFDATNPAMLQPAGSGAPEGCVWGDLTAADGSLDAGFWLPLGDYGVLGIQVGSGVASP
jgi:hypothetical protein